MVSEAAIIRESVIEDVERFTAIRRAIFPWQCASVAAQRHWFTSQPEAAKVLRLTAVAGETVVGFATGELNIAAAEPGAGTIRVVLDPAARGRGIGRALLERVEEHMRAIGVRKAQGYALDAPAVLAWTERQGYQAGASQRWSAVDPLALPPQPPAPPGVTVISLDELGAGAAYALDSEAFLDEPGDVPNATMAFEDWARQFWDSPDLDREVSLAALVDGVPAALTLVEVNRMTGRAMSAGTCTLRAFRGRGLVKLLKSMSLRRAADVGVTSAYTCNDYTNAPMLAVNDWLGYQVIGSARSVLKRL